MGAQNQTPVSFTWINCTDMNFLLQKSFSRVQFFLKPPPPSLPLAPLQFRGCVAFEVYLRFHHSTRARAISNFRPTATIANNKVLFNHKFSRGRKNLDSIETELTSISKKFPDFLLKLNKFFEISTHVEPSLDSYLRLLK